MNWQTTDLYFDEVSPNMSIETQDKNDLLLEENEHKRLVQLQNFQSQQNNGNKTIYKTVMSQFGELMLQNNKKEIMKSILTDDCEVFLFNFEETTPAQYGFRHEGFTKLFEGKRVIKREVKETSVSLKRNTGFQICDCEVIDESKGSSMSQFSFEIFSFKGNKISKYRASYGSMPKNFDPQSLFIPTKKEKMLAKIKELNHAWADQPDLERIALLLPENAEYKIYRWKDRKCFTFDKQNIVSEFKKCLEEDYVITSIVPYDVSCEAQYIYGTYVYHLKGKRELSGQKFIWVSTCVFAFDQNLNIKKMSQQGELYPEGETSIPFEAYSQEELRNQLFEPPKIDIRNGFSVFDNEVLNFSFDGIIFGPSYSFFTGHIKGLNENDLIQDLLTRKDTQTEKGNIVDVFEDVDDPCYNSVIMIGSNRGITNREGNPYCGVFLNFYIITKVSLENGKVAKLLFFICPIPDPIPSPYDDNTFLDINFRPKSEFI